MTDRELMEAAAVAAGLHVLDWVPSSCCFVIESEPGSSFRWNPLTDDGDAFRLAVKLGLRVEQDWFGGGQLRRMDGRARVLTTYSLELVGTYDVRPTWFKEDFNGDPCAATRRAIVYAAASMTGA